MTKNENDNGRFVEKLTNKAEAVRRALADLGEDASPTEIQGYIKQRFDVDMPTKVISVYKSKNAKKNMATAPSAAPIHPATTPAVLTDAISMRDLRALRELKERHGLSRLRELLELVSS